MTTEQFLLFAHPFPEPLLLIEGAGRILAANAPGLAVIGARAIPPGGLPVIEAIGGRPETVREYLRACSRSRGMVIGALMFGGTARGDETGEPQTYRAEGAVIRPWTPDVPALILVRLKSRESAGSRFVLLNRKIAELDKEIRVRRRAEEERDQLLTSERAARTEAERASQMKDEFLATLSHELRTPLNAILGWAQLLRSGVMDADEVAQGLDTIERNARVQTQIIEDLLDMSRIISGKLRLDVQPVDIPPVIEAALETVRPAAEAKGIRLQKILDPLTSPVMGDPNRLQQIIWNLLSNAIKFTPKGGRVQVILERVNSHIEISVRDTGQGIRPEFLPYVFERFRQADSSTTRRHGGLGLGLAIVRNLIELHGGTIRAKSPGEGKGATFILMLPLAVLHSEILDEKREHPRVHSAPLSDSEPISLAGISVLVVDDEPDARELVRRVLAGAEADVHLASSAAEALEVLGESSPDVLVSDIGMPEQDGYELIRMVRERDPRDGGEIPAVALTAFARSSDRRRVLLSGFQMHVAKPVEPSELIAVIASVVARRTK